MSFETEILASQALKTKDPERAVQIVSSYNNGSSSFESAMKDLNSLNSTKKEEFNNFSKKQRIDINKNLQSIKTIHGKTKSSELKAFDEFSRKMGLLDRKVQGKENLNLSTKLTNFFYATTKDLWIGSPKELRDNMIKKGLKVKSLDEAFRVIGDIYQDEIAEIIKDYFENKRNMEQEDVVNDYYGINYSKIKPIGYKNQQEKLSDIKKRLSNQKSEVSKYKNKNNIFLEINEKSRQK